MGDYYGTRRKRNIDFSRIIQEGNKTIHTTTGWANEEEEHDLEKNYKKVCDEGLEMGYEEIEDDMEEGAEAETWQEPNTALETDDDHDEFLIDGKSFVPKQKPKKKKFSDTHSRYTTYIDKNVLMILRMLQETNQIESITKCINDSIKEHLVKHYQDESL